LLPLHVQAQGPVPVTAVPVPAVQRFVVGAVVTATPFAEPQAPLTAVETRGAAQPAVLSLLKQYHLQGPVPVTGDAAPVPQRPLVGRTRVGTPFAGPHWATVFHHEAACAGAQKNRTQNAAREIILIILVPFRCGAGARIALWVSTMSCTTKDSMDIPPGKPPKSPKRKYK
jgi:hypothetical protein